MNTRLVISTITLLLAGCAPTNPPSAYTEVAEKPPRNTPFTRKMVQWHRFTGKAGSSYIHIAFTSTHAPATIGSNECCAYPLYYWQINKSGDLLISDNEDFNPSHTVMKLVKLSDGVATISVNGRIEHYNYALDPALSGS